MEIIPMADDLIYTEPTYTERTDTAIAAPTNANGGTDWSGWERWLRGHLDIQKQAMFESIAQEIAERDHQIHELELKLAECAGAIRVLRTGKTLCVRGTFDESARYEQLDVVMINGSSFVATRDNPGPCPGEGWQFGFQMSNPTPGIRRCPMPAIPGTPQDGGGGNPAGNSRLLARYRP
jgi:hypothetical protein